jgi:phosphoglycolate phosphatase
VKLILFDIDGTLINSNQAGRMALAAALRQLFGTIGSLDSYDMGGKTDLRIINEVLADDVPLDVIDAKLPELFEVMANHAAVIYPQRGILPCPGVNDLLDILGKQEGVLAGLLTGNSQATAPLKLQAAGIDPQQFRIGAYGSDDSDRNNLPAVAIRRAMETTGISFAGDNIVVVGDTPADVECARVCQARAVGVATGWHTIETLKACDPDHLFVDLSDTQAALRALLA